MSTKIQHKAKAGPLVWGNIEVLENAEKLAGNYKKIRKW